MFIDSARIIVRSGDGGRGCQSMYRDKFTRLGIPDGGDGGRGSDIIIRVNRHYHTLLDLRYKRNFRGKHGEHGSGKHKKGKDAEPIVILVPSGTIVKDARSGCILRDMKEYDEELLVARGGRGGLGNKPRLDATPGKPGEEKELLLDLSIIADVGVVGFPNAGKSTLISVISNAHPQIAAYPFTTKFPILGVVYWEDKQFVVADIPGLIEGSSQGRGLGDKFLRHVERTKILVHMVDMSGIEGRDPLDDYKTIIKELKNYGRDVIKKPQILVANKMDAEGSAENLERFKKAVKKKIIPISALNKEGLDELIKAIAKKI